MRTLVVGVSCSPRKGQTTVEALGAGLGAARWSGAPGGIAQDAAGMETARNLGRRVAGVARRLAGGETTRT